MVKYGTRIFAVEILQIKVIQMFSHFHTLPHGYIRRIYVAILSEIGRALYITVEAIIDLPVANLGNAIMGQSKWP